MGFLLRIIPQTRRNAHEIKDKQSTCFAWCRGHVSHSAATFLQTHRTPQKCSELLCSSPTDPGRICLFVQAQWSRKKRSSVTARNSKPINNVKQLEYKWHPIQDQQWTRLELWQGGPSYSTKGRCSQPKQSIQPTAHFLTPSILMKVLGLMHFLQQPKNSPKTETQGAACCWGTPTPSRRNSARIPQEQRMATGNHTWHPSLPSSQLSLNTAHSLISSSTNPSYQTNSTPGCKHTHQPCKEQPRSSSSWWEHETIRAIKKGMQRKLLCIPLPTSPPRGPVGSQGSASQWMQCLFTAIRVACPLLLHAHIYFDLNSHLPEKQPTEEGKSE